MVYGNCGLNLVKIFYSNQKEEFFLKNRTQFGLDRKIKKVINHRRLVVELRPKTQPRCFTTTGLTDAWDIFRRDRALA